MTDQPSRPLDQILDDAYCLVTKSRLVDDPVAECALLPIAELQAARARFASVQMRCHISRTKMQFLDRVLAMQKAQSG